MTDSAAVKLYQSDPKIQARSVDGRFARLRVAAVIALLGLFYVLPWLQWNGKPVVLFDLPHRRFHLFGLTLVPQDLFLLTGLLIVAAMSLFLFTTLAGRLWCGYACPQTVWTQAFMWIENSIEGSRLNRLKLDRSPWNLHKLRIRGSKHLAWLLFAFWTGFSFVGFFVPITTLWQQLWSAELAGWSAFWIGFYGFATWGNAGFMREQVCRYMCPYARFQSAMFDRDTLIIAYDGKRGEPRKPQGKNALPQGQSAGDCVNCTLCVQVCPTGIDIRDGLQYECIACAACIDACDSIMDKLDKPRGLIRYTSTRRDQEGRFHILRPRAIGYAVMWVVVCLAFLLLLLSRSPMELDVLRDRHAMVRTLASGEVENIYTLKITNKTDQQQLVSIEALDEQQQAVKLSASQFVIAPFATAREVVSVTAQAGDQASSGLIFHARTAEKGILASGEARFISGVKP